MALLSRLALLYRRTLVSNTRVVAVVGSFGKSTTTRAVEAIFSQKSLRGIEVSCGNLEFSRDMPWHVSTILMDARLTYSGMTMAEVVN